ncbi:MAG: hypothetical protein ACRBBW_16155 [Cellvibrionaceae bacterium]
MPNNLVRQLVNDDGEVVLAGRRRWHLLTVTNGDDSLLCTGEFVSDAAMSSNGAEYIHKTVERGGITCEKCIKIIKEFKAVKL